MEAIEKLDYFMSLAMLSARRSKDLSTQVGACIVNDKNRIIGLGYNGFPNGCKRSFPMSRDGDFMNTKYAYMVHAEVNAIMNATAPTDGATMFCTLYPCNECAKTIIQAGIKKLYYWSDKYHDMDFSKAARRLFSIAEVYTENLSMRIGSLEFMAGAGNSVCKMK